MGEDRDVVEKLLTALRGDAALLEVLIGMVRLRRRGQRSGAK
jgi:hypothetical protein